MGVVGLILWGILFLLFSILVFAVYVFRSRAEFYRKHKIPYIGAGINRTLRFFMGTLNLDAYVFEIYQQATTTQAPFVGISDLFLGNSLHITDLDLIKNIVAKDFDHFVNRNPVNTQQSNKYFKKMLFLMENEQWKGIRTKLSPSFTTGKIRRMFQIFKTSSLRMDKYMKNLFADGAESIDMDFEQILPKYAMDVIANTAFGIDSKSWDVGTDKKSKFEEMGNQLQFIVDIKMIMKSIFMLAAPKLADMLGVEILDQQSIKYFSRVIHDVMKRRRESGERREDFLQLMMDAQLGLLKADEETSEVMNGSSSEKNYFNEGESKVHFDDDDIIANGMVFILGGFDTTQSVLMFAVYCLALEPEVQERLHKEVIQGMEKSGGELTYEALMEMTYLDLVINECLRLYPPSPFLQRTCTKDYSVRGTDFVIKKGQTIEIPIHPIHLDRKYFPNPEKFIPERFTADAKATWHPYAYMPFGHGPRSCIAMRFALIKVKAAIAQLVKSYQFSPCAKTSIPMEYSSSGNLKPKHGMWINVKARC